MATKPTTLPTWATTGGTTVEPTAGQKAAGFAVGTRPPARWVNWLFKTIYDWLVYLQGMELAYTAPAAEAMAETFTSVQTLTIPANTLKVGSSIHVHALAHVSAQVGNPNEQLQVLIGANPIAYVTKTSVVNDDVLSLEVHATVTAIGGSGNLSGGGVGLSYDTGGIALEVAQLFSASTFSVATNGSLVIAAKAIRSGGTSGTITLNHFRVEVRDI